MHEAGSAWRVLTVDEKSSFLSVWEIHHPGDTTGRFECLLCNDTGARLNTFNESGLRNHLRVQCVCSFSSLLRETVLKRTVFFSHDLGNALSTPYRARSRPVEELEPVVWKI